MARLYRDDDAELKHLDGRRVAVLGYGSQGHAHALNLHDGGIAVVVGLPDGSRSRALASAAGLRVERPADAVREADIVTILTPDTTQPRLFREDVARFLRPGATVMFAHGFNIRFGTIDAPAGVDVAMVAPKAPGHRVRELFREGQGAPALFAIHQDASGRARQTTLAYARAIGCTRAGVIETTFAEETETDLFGEQAVLCGGVSALVKAAFETLVGNGYQPEVAYFECLHELKLIVDLMYRGGLSYMRHSVSDTAEYGDYTRGHRLVTEKTRGDLQAMLEEIRSGAFAREWIHENETGRAWFEGQRRAEREHALETVGARLRGRIPFLDPVEVAPDGTVVRAPASPEPAP